MKTLHAAFLSPLLALLPAHLPDAAGREPSPTPHCQVPCGIYGDKMRIDMLMEDAATIEKAMAEVRKMESSDRPNYNQVVRWVTTKDHHAQHVQEMAADYWLAQRIKMPGKDAGEAEQAKYREQLQHLHGIVVAAMKCKQTTDAAHVEQLRGSARALAKSYFSKEDLEHIEGHHKDQW